MLPLILINTKSKPQWSLACALHRLPARQKRAPGAFLPVGPCLPPGAACAGARNPAEDGEAGDFTVNYELDAVGAGLAANVAPVEVIVAGKPAPTRICDRLSARGSGLGREKTCEARIRGQARSHRQWLPRSGPGARIAIVAGAQRGEGRRWCPSGASPAIRGVSVRTSPHCAR